MRSDWRMEGCGHILREKQRRNIHVTQPQRMSLYVMSCMCAAMSPLLAFMLASIADAKSAWAFESEVAENV